VTNAILDPWGEAIDEFPLTGTPIEKLRAVARFALLAPSGHNSQPWLFRPGDDFLDLLADRSRALPVVDPEDRELVISCGCALLNLRVALEHFGYRCLVEILPDPADPDLLARIRVGEAKPENARTNAQFNGIRRRRTNRFPFEDRVVPEPVLGRARAAAEQEGTWLQTLTGSETRLPLADLIAEADHQQMLDRRFRRELAAWVHPNRTGSRDGMPGFAHGVGAIASVVEPLVIRTFDVGKGMAARDRQLALGSPVLAVLWTETEGPQAWIAAGQALARSALSLVADGVAMSYLNQPIELPELRERLRAQLGREGFPQILMRLGYATRDTRPTPRRPLDQVLLPAEASPAQT
jgi:hypothetical protein